MPTVELTDAMRARKLSRALIVGAPNMYKTSSLRTWPRPNFIYSYPGEQGTGAIPTGEGIIARTFESDPTDNPMTTWNEVVKVTKEALGGKYGKIQTFSGDGLYQLACLALDTVSNGEFSAGIKVDPFLYPLATNKVKGYLKMVMDSPVPYAVFTVWEGKEVVDPMANAKSDAPRALYPHLPGALAKEVMGMFSLVLYCEMGAAKTLGGSPEGRWRLRPTATVRAASVKMPVELVVKLPDTVEQDWAKLEPLLKV